MTSVQFQKELRFCGEYIRPQVPSIDAESRPDFVFSGLASRSGLDDSAIVTLRTPLQCFSGICRSRYGMRRDSHIAWRNCMRANPPTAAKHREGFDRYEGRWRLGTARLSSLSGQRASTKTFCEGLFLKC